LTATDYFTKWTEVVPLKHSQDEQVISFLKTIFGLPLEIITDNGPAFIFAKMTQFLAKLGVKYINSSSYYPQGNGKVDSTNKNLVRIIKRLIEDKPRQWHTLLTYALWADHTTTKVSTGFIPFHLVYGQESILPTELELSSLRLMLQVEELNSSNMSQRMNALLALEEQRKFSLDNIKKKQQTVKIYFNKSDKDVKFNVNEKVLLWDSTHAYRERHSKFQKLWLGPFKIAFFLGTNSYILKDLQERLFSYSTNSSHLKNYVEPT
jgi:transposase InsO family protein